MANLAERDAPTRVTAPPGRRSLSRWRTGRSRSGTHLLFGALLLAGAVLRGLTLFAYRPALLFSDSLSYLANAQHLAPDILRPLGYAGFLAPILYLPQPLFAVALIQHLMGLLIAVLLYAVLLRRGVRWWLAALATAPVLLDAHQLVIEQYVLSDTLFELLLVIAYVLIAWYPERMPAWATALAGLALALAVVTRFDGVAMFVPALGYLLLLPGGWRRRLSTCALLLVTFLVPLGLYAGAYDVVHGQFAISGYSGHFLYGRVAGFANCRGLALPSYERGLCPTQPVGQRPANEFYIWDKTSPAQNLSPPPGVSDEQALKDFALRVLRHQPGDYAKSVLANVGDGFSPTGPPGDAWVFTRDYPLWGFDPAQAAAAYGGGVPHANQGLTGFLLAYGRFGTTPGPAVAAMLVVGLLGGLGLGRARRAKLRLVCLLFTLGGVAVLLPADALSVFSWRYQVPGLDFLPVAAALGVSALFGIRGSRPTSGAHGAHRSLREAADTPAVTEAAMTSFHQRYGDPQLAPLVVVIAAYEEARNIGPVLDEVAPRIGGLAVSTLVVDDGSSDRTAEVAAEHGALVCRLAVNRGHGVALRVGYRIAREYGGRYIATLDADGQWDPADLPAMVRLLERGDVDFALGSRRLGRTDNTDRLRNVGVRFFAWLVSRLTGTRVTDTSSGLRLMRAELTGTVRQTQPQYQTSELLIGALGQGYRVAEVPTTMRRRLSGETKKGRNLTYGLRYARVIVGTWLRERSAASSRPSPRGRSVPAGEGSRAVPAGESANSQ